ncbi:MAG: HAMP domain-containing histidine kinase [Muribaculaceae bacterium]|nr:HAMP domain-containing histidine kinase [Muribaculaceae bacterium]
MKRLKIIMTLSLAVAAAAVIAATCSLFRLYLNERDTMMETVRECAGNAVMLEMIGRMQSGEDAGESFIRLNAFTEMVQQKDGRPANADTLRITLAGLLRFGLEFQYNRPNPDQAELDSIFRAELGRHGLKPGFASILQPQSEPENDSRLWCVAYNLTPEPSPEYMVYVSPMPGNVLAGMWGIILPFICLILIFSFLTLYLSRTVSRLKTLEQMKDDFTHNMTHELKTPVAVAYSAADSMLRYYDQSDEKRNRQFLNIIIQRLGVLSGMIENILSMSTERFRTMKLKTARTAIKPVVAEVAEMIRLKADKPVNVTIDIPDNLAVVTDPLHFGNVVSNLLDNAVKYSGESVDITVRADGGSISVADNGIGIAGDNLPYIFDKFYRVSSGDRYETTGYGLGLFYVRQIVELQGWSIGVTSVPGKGTEFTIKF